MSDIPESQKVHGQRQEHQPDPPVTGLLQPFSIPILMLGVVAMILLATWGLGVISQVRVKSPDLQFRLEFYGFAATCTFLSLWLVFGAIFAYIKLGQKKKIEFITGFYTPETIADYFEQFWSSRDGVMSLVTKYRDSVSGPQQDIYGKRLMNKLSDLFRDDFGLRVYLVPIVLLTAVGSIVLFFGYVGGIQLALRLGPGDTVSNLLPPNLVSSLMPFGIRLDLVSIAAIFGAYTWVASDVIVRNHQWTLHPSDLAWYALRMIIAIPLGEALALTVGNVTTVTLAGGPTTNALPAGAGAFVAFMASMFSLDAITTALGTAATRFGVQMSSSNEERSDLVIRLAGVDEAKARALNVEGVSTIGQLVTVDPIRTSIRTGLPFEYVLNLIDAALLWVFVGDKLKFLAPLGLRGASDVLALDEEWRADDSSSTAMNSLRDADAALTKVAQKASIARDALATAPQGGTDSSGLESLKKTVSDTEAAVVAATTARDLSVSKLLVVSAARPSPAIDRSAMLAALALDAAGGGPGLTEIGFLTIASRLRTNKYAIFIRRLIES